MIQQAIARVVEASDLAESEMVEVMEEITEGKASHAQIGALLVALRMKGECVEEIAAAARVMRSKSARVPVGLSRAVDPDSAATCNGEAVVDTCGTGGDGSGTFNVSTTAAFVVAGAGLRVAKHGNRSISSRCGSADLVEALGVPLDLQPEQVGLCIDRAGIGFLYAPALHSAMRHVIGPRKELGLRTIFNVLGPLTNPAGANVQVLGVYREDLVETMALVLRRLGCDSAFVVHGEGGYDEFTITGSTSYARLHNGAVSTGTLHPEDVALPVATREDLRGGDASRNAALSLGILSGEAGPRRDMVLLNAAAAVVAAGRADSFQEGVAVAAESIDSGAALRKLKQLMKIGRELKQVQPATTAGKRLS